MPSGKCYITYNTTICRLILSNNGGDAASLSFPRTEEFLKQNIKGDDRSSISRIQPRVTLIQVAQIRNKKNQMGKKSENSSY
jgi:hypothetical protein